MQKKGKSQYNMIFSCSWQEVDYVIQNWLNQNKFSYVEKNNKKYYVKGNTFTRKIFFEYYYVNNNGHNVVTISTYCRNGNGPWPIENKSLLNTAGGAIYLASIRDLLGMIYNVSSQYEQQPSYQTDYHKLAGLYGMDWQMQVERKMGDHALYGMLIGLAGIVLNFMGIALGLLVLIWGLQFCFDGLHSKKEYMSYIGFATISIGFVVWVIAMVNIFR